VRRGNCLDKFSPLRTSREALTNCTLDQAVVLLPMYTRTPCWKLAPSTWILNGFDSVVTLDTVGAGCAAIVIEALLELETSPTDAVIFHWKVAADE
jgi:hypothetical protein